MFPHALLQFPIRGHIYGLHSNKFCCPQYQDWEQPTALPRRAVAEL